MCASSTISSAGRPTPEDENRRVEILCRTSLDALVVVDDERRYLRINEPAARLLGAPTAQVLRRRIEDFTPPEHRHTLEDLWSELQRSGTQDGQYEVLRGDGERMMIEYRASWEWGPGEHLIAAREIGIRARLGDGQPWIRRAPTVLTRRELEVLQLVAGGRSSPEIGAALFVSTGTIKTHLKNIYRKLAVRDRGSAVAEGLRRGLIE
jgi:PAS domain S-box-containing protein